MRIYKISVLVFIASILLTLLVLVYPMISYGQKWRIMKTWTVPWSQTTVWLTFGLSEISSIVTLLVLQQVGKYLGIQEFRSEEGAKQVLLKQIMDATAELGILYCVVSFYKPLPDELFYWGIKEPFNLQQGWLLWAKIGIICAIGATTGISVAMDYFVGRVSQEGQTDHTVFDGVAMLFPANRSPRVSLTYLLIASSVLGPIVEEYIFRGFIMASMTHWFPTPVAVVISAVLFALSHVAPRELNQFFASGISSEALSISCFGLVLGFSYAQTRNLLTPFLIHSAWNAGVLLLSLYKLRRYVAKRRQEGRGINEL